MLAGAGVVGTAAGLMPAKSVSAAPKKHMREPKCLPTLPVSADWSKALARTPRVQLVPGATYVLDNTVDLPAGCYIAGSGATVTVSRDSVGALTISEQNDVTITDVRFLGQGRDPINTAAVFAHVALRITRCTNVRVQSFDFSNWLGAGIVVTGSFTDDYFAYRLKLQGNAFYSCYFGVSITDRGEYGVLSGNSFAYCRLAIWNSAGNWVITGNSSVLCYRAYHSMAQTSPYGALTQDNWSHGSLVGNTFNHPSAGATGQWTLNASFLVGGRSDDPDRVSSFRVCFRPRSPETRCGTAMSRPSASWAPAAVWKHVLQPEHQLYRRRAR